MRAEARAVITRHHVGAAEGLPRAAGWAMVIDRQERLRGRDVDLYRAVL